MDDNEPFVYNEVDYQTPKQSPKTWPRDKIKQSRIQQKSSSLLSPATPKRDYSISNAKSLLLQCLRDAKSDPLPRRRFPVSCSDEGILMDGVLVTSATKKKVSDSLSSSIGRSAHSSICPSQHNKDTEFGSPISESGGNQETTRSQQSSDGKGNALANSPCTLKAANLSKLQASAEPFILTQRQASPFLPKQLQFDYHNPQFPCTPYPYLHRPRPLIYFYQRPPFLPLLPQRPTRNNRRNSLPTTPSSSQPNTTTSDPPVHTPISTIPTANTSTTTNSNTHGSSPSADGLGTVTQIPDLSSSPSQGLETVTPKPDFSLLPSHGLETVTPNQELTSPPVGVQTMTINEDWSPSDDGLPTFTQAQIDFMKAHNRVLPDKVFGRYKYRKRMSAFRHQEEDQ